MIHLSRGRGYERQETADHTMRCSGCGGRIKKRWFYTEAVSPNEERKQFCGRCRPIAIFGVAYKDKYPTGRHV